MKPLDYAILAVIAVWFVLAVRSIWKRRGSCCGCQGCTAEKEKILHSEKKKKNRTAAAAAHSPEKTEIAAAIRQRQF